MTENPSKAIKKQEKSGTTKLLDNKDFLIIQPHTYEANCYYGAGTKWCTTDKEEGPEKFEEYTEYKPITFIIDKSKTQSDPLYKVALSYETYYTTNNKGERFNTHELTVWNAEDELDRKSTRLNSSHVKRSRMPSSA